MDKVYHVPVMLGECMDALAIKPGGVYVDVTFGGGGHSKELLNYLDESGRLFAFDQDPDALENSIADDRFVFIQHNFRFMKNHLRLYGVTAVDGILADLGVSSRQFDDAKRGFSTRFDALLDMRMDQAGDLNARKVLNTYPEADLHRIFGMYGEVHNARTLANAIAAARIARPIQTVEELKDIIKASKLAPRGKEHKYYAQLFQALRIEVNRELEALQEFLLQSASLLKPGGRLVIMSYHSLEDRAVKHFMAKGKFKGEVERDFYGNEIKPFRVINRKALIASDAEVARNSRARSAKLRIAEKL